MDAFATLGDLQDRGMVIPDEYTLAAHTLLGDASEHLRSIIGPLVVPPRTVTIDLYQWPGDTWLTIPVPVVRSITSMVVNGTAVVDPKLRDGAVHVCGPADVSLVVEAGLDAVPAELVSWTCVLAAEALKSMMDLGVMGPGRVASIAIDDFRQAYQAGSAGDGPFCVPGQAADSLRARYGSGGVTVVGTR